MAKLATLYDFITYNTIHFSYNLDVKLMVS